MTNPGGAVGTNGAYGGRTSVNAFNDVLSAFNGRGILNGWNAVPGGGMVVNLGGSAMVRDVAIVENDLGQLTTINNISTQPIPVLLDAAPTLGSRIDVIVGYVNNPPDAVQTNPVQIDNPSVCGLIAVQSGVSTNPSVPTEDMIRAAITADGGAGTTAYYVILATVEVGTGVTTITPSAITPGPMAIIGSAAIADGSVTTQKLADGAVSNAKLATEAVKSNNIDWGTMSWTPSVVLIDNIDVDLSSGLYFIAANAGSGTFPLADKNLSYFVLQFNLNTNYQTQYASVVNDGRTYVRSRGTTGWHEWKQLRLDTL